MGFLDLATRRRRRMGSATPMGGAAPTINGRERTVQDTAGAPVTVNSGSPVAGELILLHLAYGGFLVPSNPIVWPSGFTQGDRKNHGWAQGAWAWKIATGSEPSTYDVSWVGSAYTRTILSLLRIGNHNGIAGNSEAWSETNTNNRQLPAFSSTPAPSLRVAFFSFGWGGGTMTVTPPSTSPATTVEQSPVFSSTGDSNAGCGAMTLSKEEDADDYALLTATTSWSLNGTGCAYQAFSIAIKHGLS